MLLTKNTRHVFDFSCFQYHSNKRFYDMKANIFFSFALHKNEIKFKSHISSGLSKCLS